MAIGKMVNLLVIYTALNSFHATERKTTPFKLMKKYNILEKYHTRPTFFLCVDITMYTIINNGQVQ